MKRLSWLTLFAAALAFLAGCNTTSAPYGYYTHGLDEESILEFFAVSDQAVNERDYETYKSLFGPGFSTINKTDLAEYDSAMTKYEYMDMVRDIMRDAKSIHFYTTVMEIDIDPSGERAFVKVQEDETIDLHGRPRRIVSILEAELGFEDGWIYFDRMERTAQQEIRDYSMVGPR